LIFLSRGLDWSKEPGAISSFLILVFVLLVCFSPATLAGDGQRDYVKYVVEVEYNPEDFVLELDFGLEGDNLTLTRGWVENTYIYLESENFTATRQVVVDYRSEPIYEVWSWYVPGATQFPGLEDDLAGYDRQTLQGLESRRDEEFWKDYFWTEGLWPLEEVEPNTFQDPREFAYPHESYGWIAFQGFTDWRRKTVHIWQGRDPGTYTVWIPHQFHYLVEVGRRQVPIYENQEYTAYRNTLYEVTDHILDNWPVLRATVTLRGENGYEGDVHLSVEVDDDLIDIGLEDEVLHVTSEASTALTVLPSQELQESSHLIAVTASDSNGRTKMIILELELLVGPEPPVENVVLEEWESETPPDETGKIKAKYKGWIGVDGRVYDAQVGDSIPLVTGDVRVNGHPLRKGPYTLKGLNGYGQYWYRDLIWGQDKVENYTVVAKPGGYYSQIKTTSDRSGGVFAMLDFYLSNY
jgi:hypothetical protein